MGSYLNLLLEQAVHIQLFHSHCTPALHCTSSGFAKACNRRSHPSRERKLALLSQVEEAMAPAKMLLLLVVTLALVSVDTIKRCDAQDTTERYHVCNGARMPDWEYQQATLNAINEVVARTSGPGYAYKAQSTVSGKTGYSGGACNGQIDQAACNRCMAVAYSVLRQWCVSSTGSYAVGARIELNDCRLRWELYYFEPKVSDFTSDTDSLPTDETLALVTE